MKILIAEDDPSLRTTLQDILELNGHEVLVAEDGVQGLALAAQSPEFIFSDINMPHLDGHGLLAGIKKLPGVCDVPFVFLTANAERTQLRAGMALGADDYITKPYSVRDILEAIEARTRRHQGVRERLEILSEARLRETEAQWSHELLTPLNAVLGCLSLLEEEADTIGRGELKEVLALLRTGAERQERLSRKLIRYFELELIRDGRRPAGDYQCRADLAVLSAASRAAQEAGRAGNLAITAVPGEVGLSEERLAESVFEVVNNAFRFSPPGTTVTVSARPEAGDYRIEVTDQGPGLTPEQCGQIGPFVQFDRKRREQQGLGLGLAIARQSARLGGGELTLAPGPQGQGLQASFRLPVTKP